MPEDRPTAGGIYVGQGRYAAVINRGDHWQIGYVFAKGTCQRVRGAGLDALRASLADLVRWLADGRLEVLDWNGMSLLSPEASYVRLIRSSRLCAMTSSRRASSEATSILSTLGPCGAI